MTAMRFRALVEEDAAAWLALIAERQLTDEGVAEITIEEIRARWASPVFDAAVDTLACELNGRVIAVASRERHVEVVDVGAAHRGRGIGAELLRWVMGRTEQRGAGKHRQMVGSQNAAARALLTRSGYAVRRSYLRMSVALGQAIAPAPPDAITIRAIDVAADLPQLHRLDAAAFAADPGYESMGIEEFRAEELRRPDFDPRASLVAVQRSRIVGSLLATERQGATAGYVTVLAVHPSVHGRGIGTALLRSAFSIFAASGRARGELSVASDNPRALRLYRHLGMTALYRTDVYERPIIPG